MVLDIIRERDPKALSNIVSGLHEIPLTALNVVTIWRIQQYLSNSRNEKNSKKVDPGHSRSNRNERVHGEAHEVSRVSLAAKQAVLDLSTSDTEDLHIQREPKKGQEKKMRKSKKRRAVFGRTVRKKRKKPENPRENDEEEYVVKALCGKRTVRGKTEVDFIIVMHFRSFFVCMCRSVHDILKLMLIYILFSIWYYGAGITKRGSR